MFCLDKNAKYKESSQSATIVFAYMEENTNSFTISYLIYKVRLS